MPRPGRSTGPRVAALPAAVASTAAFAALWLPWVRTGTTRRSAFRVVSALRGAGLMSRRPADLFFAAIAVIPGLAVATWVLWATGYRRASAAAAILTGALTVASTLVVRRVAHHRAASTLSLATAAGAAALGLGLATLAVDGWNDRGKATT